jgi:hypothetical protein
VSVAHNGARARVTLDGAGAPGIKATEVVPLPVFLLCGSAGRAERMPPAELVQRFSSEGAAREAFGRLRLTAGPGAGWGLLVALDEAHARPLAWFGLEPAPPHGTRGEPRRSGEAAGEPGSTRPRRSRRWVAALAVTIVAGAAWVFLGPGERAVAAVAPHSLKTALVTVTEMQRVEATAANDSHSCHRTQISLINGHGHVVARKPPTCAPAAH